MTQQLVEEVRKRLAQAADAERAVGQQRYMKSAMPFFGVAMPQVRRLTRECVRDHPVADQRDLERTVRSLWDEATHREEWYAALAVLMAPAHRVHRDRGLLPLIPAGRQLLEEVLEGAIIHRGDHFTAMDTTSVASSSAPAARTTKAAAGELRLN